MTIIEVIWTVLTKLAVSVKPSTAAERGPHSNTEKICTAWLLWLKHREHQSLLAAMREGERESERENRRATVKNGNSISASGCSHHF